MVLFNEPLPVLGLSIALIIHLIFYYLVYKRDSTFTGLLKTQENLLVDSIVIMGGIQITYFFWRISQGDPSMRIEILDNLVNAAGFTFLGLFAYVSYELIKTMESISDEYTVNLKKGESD